MPVVRLPDGTLVRLPDEEPSAVSDVAKAVPSKLAEGALKVPFLFSDLLNLGLDLTEKKFSPEWMKGEGYQDFRKAHKGSQWVDEALGAAGGSFYQPQTRAGEYAGSMAEGVGGGLSSVVGSAAMRALPRALLTASPANARTVAAAVKPTIAAGLAGGAAAEGIREIPGLDNPLASAGASTVASIAAALLTGRTPPGQKKLFEAGQGVPEGDWRQAQANRALLEATGSDSATLGDVFPTPNRLTGMVADASKMRGGEPLAQRFAGRSADLAAQGDAAKAQVGPAVRSLDTVGQDAARAASDRIDQFKNVRSEAFRRLVESAPDLRGRDIAQVYQLFRLKAQQRDLPQGMREAYRELANTLVQDGVRFKTNVAALARDIKANKARTLSPNAETAAKIEAMDYNPVYQELNDALETLSPAYAKANSRYRRISEALVNPAEAGPLGQVAGRNFRENVPQPANRVLEIVKGQSPDDVRTVMRSIQRGAPNDPELSSRIARAIVDQTIPNQSTDAWNRVSKMAGPDPLGSMEEVVRAGGGNPQEFLQNLEANRLLQGSVPTPAGMGDIPPTVAQTAVQPWKSVGRKLGLAQEQRVASEIASIMANPTEANLQRLMQIVQTNPEIKASLVRAGVINAQGQFTRE